MDSLFVSLIVAAVSGLAYLAYKHPRAQLTIGLDLGDRSSAYCVSVVRNAPNEPSQEIELVSKPLILTIAPADAEWQEGQLASALEVLTRRSRIDKT